MSRFTVEGLIQNFRDRLGLTLISGDSGFTNDIEHAKVQRYLDSETFWDQMEPKTILILSSAGLAKLNAASSSGREKIFKAIVSADIPCIALSRIRFLPLFMTRFSNM